MTQEWFTWSQCPSPYCPYCYASGEVKRRRFFSSDFLQHQLLMLSMGSVCFVIVSDAMLQNRVSGAIWWSPSWKHRWDKSVRGWRRSSWKVRSAPAARPGLSFVQRFLPNRATCSFQVYLGLCCLSVTPSYKLKILNQHPKQFCWQANSIEGTLLCFRQ